MNFLIAAIFLTLASSIAARSTTLNGFSNVQDPLYCYATDGFRPQLPRWSDRTSYDSIRGRNLNTQVSSCTPDKFWLYMRHSDRNPSRNDILRMRPFSDTPRTDIINAYNAGRSTLCPQDFNAINNWNWNSNITEENEQFLTVSGWNMAKDLARRYQREFPSLLPNFYDRNHFAFRYTDRQRTQATVRAFADGLFGENAYRGVFFPTPPTPDALLRPHDNCPMYDEASDTEVERGRWQNSAEFQATLTQVNDKLGLQGGQRLSARQMRTMWEICQFNQLWYPQVDAPFCGAISPFDNLRLEYFEDIDAFYTAGWGLNPVRLAENLNCPLMQDLLGFLTSTNPNEEKVRIYSSHQTAFQLFLVSLGLFRDEVPINADNFAQQANRQWVTSRMAPMTTNIVAVRYRCSGVDNDDVLFLMNEMPLVIPGCQASGLCKVRDITARYSRFITANCATLSCSAD